MAAKSKEFLPVAVSSASGLPTEKSIGSLVRSSSKTAANAVELADTVSGAVDSPVSISLVASGIGRPQRFMRRLHKENNHRAASNPPKEEIAVDSVDTADRFTRRALIRKIGKSIQERRFGEVIDHAGWYALSTRSEKHQFRRLRQALDATGATTVKANANFFINENEEAGERLVENLVQYQERTDTKLSLAVEIDSEGQSPDQYFEFMKEFRTSLKDRINVVMDIDLGHIVQRGGDPLVFLRKVFSDEDLKHAVGFISFNQYVEGNSHAHSPLNAEGGMVKFEAVMMLLREHKQGLEAEGHTPPTILFEPHPGDKEIFNETVGALGPRLHDIYLAPDIRPAA